ncbi:MAG: 1-acyl-sn-glycerol-3-phosphate acyltransferase [Oscillochloris sp.]|nr:1-acyl-sn-glycerol-3-phosphate acyltransferase [Oscillochloris sp.]
MLGALMYGVIFTFIHAMRAIRWWRWSIHGIDNLPPRDSGGMVIAMNHISWLDIPAVGAMLPFRYRLSWLAKSEIFQNPIAVWWLRQMQVIPIKRGKRDLAALDAAAEALRQGAVLLIFPEGHRSRDGVLRVGRGGAVRLAAQAGVPIVPVSILGTEYGLKGALARKRLDVTVGKPYRVLMDDNGKISPDRMDRLTNQMMQRIAALLPADRRGPYLLSDNNSDAPINDEVAG